MRGTRNNICMRNNKKIIKKIWKEHREAHPHCPFNKLKLRNTKSINDRNKLW